MLLGFIFFPRILLSDAFIISKVAIILIIIHMGLIVAHHSVSLVQVIDRRILQANKAWRNIVIQKFCVGVWIFQIRIGFTCSVFVCVFYFWCSLSNQFGGVLGRVPCFRIESLQVHGAFLASIKELLMSFIFLSFMSWSYQMQRFIHFLILLIDWLYKFCS